MALIERLERAQQQIWWLPDSAEIYQGSDHCFYFNGGRFSIVRFTPSSENLTVRLTEIRERIGTHPATFTYFPHRHDEPVIDAFKSLGFRYKNRYEARAIHVDEYDRTPPGDIKVTMVETFEKMKQVYLLRQHIFQGRTLESDESIRRYVKDASGPNARVFSTI